MRAVLVLFAVVGLVACGADDPKSLGRPSGGNTVTSSSSSGAGGAGGGLGAGGAGGATSSACSPECADGLSCCDGECVDTGSDLRNCGMCGKACTLGDHPFCNDGLCEEAPCTTNITCGSGDYCCGAACCAADHLCCPTADGVACVSGSLGYCPP